MDRWTTPSLCSNFQIAMETPYQQLAAALRERLTVIGDRTLRERDPAAHLEALRTASEKIAQLQSQLPPNADPQLRHFLQRCSYDKALAMLESD
jgi:hypothetical protein